MTACVDCTSYDLQTGFCDQKETIDIAVLIDKVNELKENLISPNDTH